MDSSIRNTYLNRINMNYATTIDWKQEPHNHMAGVMNAISEDLQWYFLFKSYI